MSASMPPAVADTGDRASDFGSSEFWRKGVPSMAPASMPPESRAPVVMLSAEQQARRRKLQRIVSYVVGGALLFTGVAALAHFVLGTHDLPSATDSAAPAVHAAAPALPTAPAQNSAATDASNLGAPVNEDSATSTSTWRDFVKSPSADPRTLEAWSSTAAKLKGDDLAEALKQLTRKTNVGRRTQREAAGLGLAILWRAQLHQAEARKMLTRLAKHAGDRGVRDYAGKMLAQG